jgi:RecA/RadA recombinase
MAKTDKKEKKEETIVTPESLLNTYVKDNSADNINAEEEVFYRVSLGSLILDVETGGGLTPGLHRFCGINEGGKTSEALEVARNFQKLDNARVILFKAEGRLSPEMKERSGLKFSTDPKEWAQDTVFVYESNVFESVIGLMRTLVYNNSTKVKYMFIVDSVDGLMLRDDVEKAENESSKVAGGALLSAVMMKRMNLAMCKRGHMAIFISQVRADVQLDPYAKKTVRQTTATGGNALLHFANFIFEFEPRYQSKDLILENEKAKPDTVENKILGHYAKITIKKSPNEKTNYTIPYPIKYGRVGGNSIWIEKEVAALIIQFGFATRKGAWVYFDEKFLKELKDNNIECVDKINGIGEFENYFENSPELTQYCYNKFKTFLLKVKT